MTTIPDAAIDSVAKILYQEDQGVRFPDADWTWDDECGAHRSTWRRKARPLVEAAAPHIAAAAVEPIVEAIESHGRGEQDADDTLAFVADTVDEIRGRAHQSANGGGG